MTLGEKLYYYRKAAGYTQKELSALLQVPQSAYVFYETDRAEPSLKNTLRIAKLYGVTMETLVSEEHEPKIQNKSETEERA